MCKDRFFCSKNLLFLRSARLERVRKLLNAHAWCWNQPFGLVWGIHGSSVRQWMRGFCLTYRERGTVEVLPGGQKTKHKTLRSENWKNKTFESFDSKPCGMVDLWGKKKILKEGCTCVAGSELVGGKVDRYVSGLSNYLTLGDFFIFYFFWIDK